MRINPNDGKYRMHYGEDTKSPGNYAPVTGTVVFAALDKTGTGLGQAVGIREAANPTVIWWVAHNAALRVAVGQAVTQGKTYLGATGETGAAKGIHCHTERRVGGAPVPGSGKATNPRDYYGSSTPAGGGTDGIEDDMFDDNDRYMLQQVMAVLLGKNAAGAEVALDKNVNWGQPVIIGIQEARKGVQHLIDHPVDVAKLAEALAAQGVTGVTEAQLDAALKALNIPTAEQNGDASALAFAARLSNG